MKAEEFESTLLDLLTDEWMTITLIQHRFKETGNTVHDDLISLWCGMLINEQKIDAITIHTKNSIFYAIRKKQKNQEDSS